MESKKSKNFNPVREQIHEIIFEADTASGKLFDIVLLIFILGSVIAVMLESVDHIRGPYADFFTYLEWFFTAFFTIEYFLRIYAVYSPRKYIFSFFGIVDLLAILPVYLSLIFAGSHYLVVIRSLRLLRVFRIFKLARFVNGGFDIMRALKASSSKIFVFLFFILVIVTILGSIVYFIEGNAGSGFTSIPRSIYWAVVTLTTVGYGDIAPVTELGQFVAALVMILGYSVIAVPTGIVSAEMVNPGTEEIKAIISTQACKNCSKEGHDVDAEYCKYCGEPIH